MQYLQDALQASDVPRGGVATIGNFDGLHRGQRAIVDRVVERARELGVPSLAITFEPHPLAVLRPEQAPKRLSTPAQKERLFEDSGLDALLVVRFNAELAQTSAETFVRDFLARRLAVREIHVGSRFAFGKGREGTLDLLRTLGAELGFSADGVEEVVYRGEAVSSTRIRHALSQGEVDEATAMLGRPYAISGRIVRGDRMGKKLGWPTINLAPVNELLPGNGVYATRVFFPSFPATFEAVTNVGTRPTLYENYRKVVESHILEFSGDVYDEQVELHFLKRLRDERTFPSVMELSAQIARDVDATREYFQARRRLEGVAAAE